MKAWTYAVTYEYENEAPDCHRGEAKATSIATAAARALRVAKKAFPRKRPRSVVVLIQEKDKDV